MGGVCSLIRPNIITLAGFLMLLISHVFIAYYSWNFQNAVPRYVCAIAAFNYFAYQVLDCADGKQARKTKSSSPLGMMFDHGCDAVGSILTTCNMMALTHTITPYDITQDSIAVFSGFYIATFETYHTGEMNLEKLNPVTDGSVLIIFCYLITALVGDGLWRFVLCTIGGKQIYISTVALLISVAAQIFGGVMKSIDNIKCKSQYKPVTNKDIIIENMMICLLLAASVMCLFSGVLHNYPRLVMYCIGSMYTIMNVKTLLCQVIRARLSLCTWEVIVGSLLLVGHSILCLMSLMESDSLLAILVCSAFCMVSYVLYHVRVLRELRDTLGIHAFSIAYKDD